jgi:S-adenosylmethionine decarboxylase proenzyme
LKALGRHLLIEFYGCDRDILNDVEQVKKEMKEAAIRSGATVVDTVFHLFNPHGVSGVVVIAESHLAIHTWPEFGYCALDIFTCGNQINSQKALVYFKKSLKAANASVMEIKRGLLNLPRAKIKHKPDSLPS